MPAIAVVSVVLGLPTPLRGVVVLLTLCTCPGVAVMPFLRVRPRIAAVTIAIVLSLAANTIISQVFLLGGMWQPTLVLVAIWGVSALAAAWHWSIRNPSAQVRPTEHVERLLEKTGIPWSARD
jgi:hypothetical protein